MLRYEGPQIVANNHIIDIATQLPLVEPQESPKTAKIVASPFIWRAPETLPTRPWVYGHQLLRETVSLIVGMSGSGKSALMSGTVLALATGKPLLGSKVHGGPKRVWLWNLEDSQDELSRGILAAAKHYGITKADIAERLFVDSGLGDTKTMLFDEVSGMSLDNFLVRAKRRAVEQFQVRDAWDNLSAEDRHTLINDVAGLPSAVGDGDISAKQFDYLILKGQLDLLENSASFVNCKDKVITIASCLETLGNVPMVAAEMALILEIQTEEYWTDINPWMLETLRRRLRNLIKLIEGEAKQIVYTDFTDEIGDGTKVALPDAGVGTDKARFQLKVRHFLQAHSDHIAILKLRRNEQLTPQDLSELERIMVEESVATNDDLSALHDQGGLGLFIRSLVGLERDAAKGAFAGFLGGRNMNANQIEFINLIIDHLTENGAMEPKRLYESPFTDLDDQGVGGLFPQADVLKIVQVLNDVKLKAAA